MNCLLTINTSTRAHEPIPNVAQQKKVVNKPKMNNRKKSDYRQLIANKRPRRWELPLAKQSGLQCKLTATSLTGLPHSYVAQAWWRASVRWLTYLP